MLRYPALVVNGSPWIECRLRPCETIRCFQLGSSYEGSPFLSRLNKIAVRASLPRCLLHVANRQRRSGVGEAQGPNSRGCLTSRADRAHHLCTTFFNDQRRANAHFLVDWHWRSPRGNGGLVRSQESRSRRSGCLTFVWVVFMVSRTDMTFRYRLVGPSSRRSIFS